MQRKTSNLKTVRSIREYMDMTPEKWPFSLTELERLQRASKVLLSLGFTDTYKMGYNVIHWAHVVAGLSTEFASESQHPNFIWLCNKVASLFRKKSFPHVVCLTLMRGDTVTMPILTDPHTSHSATWTNEKTQAVFTIGYHELY